MVRIASEHANEFAEVDRRMSAVTGKSLRPSGHAKTAAEYPAIAEECFKWARKTYTAEVRETYLQLAQFWLELASKCDGPRAAKRTWSCKMWLGRAVRVLIVAHEPGM